MTSKDKRDMYYRLAKEEGYRARSAYKLIQISQTYNLLDNVYSIVDLCAAPGGWTQVVASKERNVVAVDLQEMKPIPYVTTIKGDIADQHTANLILNHYNGNKVDLVIVDGAPDIINISSIDEHVQDNLILTSLNITTCILRNGGTFISKNISR